MRRSLLIASGLLAITIVVPTVVAVAGTKSQPLVVSASPGRERGTWRATPIATATTGFRALGGLQSTICSTGEVAVTLSVDGRGAPMDLRVRIDDGALLAPGPVVFAPGSYGSIASFTFLISTSAFEGNDHHLLQAEWRSPTGQRTTMRSATMNVIYQAGTHQC